MSTALASPALRAEMIAHLATLSAGYEEVDGVKLLCGKIVGSHELATVVDALRVELGVDPISRSTLDILQLLKGKPELQAVANHLRMLDAICTVLGETVEAIGTMGGPAGALARATQEDFDRVLHKAGDGG